MKKFFKITMWSVVALTVVMAVLFAIQKEWALMMYNAALAMTYVALINATKSSDFFHALLELNKASYAGVQKERDELQAKVWELEGYYKDLKDAEKREAIFHKTIEDQRKENYSMSETIGALQAQLTSTQSYCTTLKMKLSRKPRPKNVTPVKPMHDDAAHS